MNNGINFGAKRNYLLGLVSIFSKENVLVKKVSILIQFYNLLRDHVYAECIM